MRRYWDYSEAERANLTAEQVEKLLSYELMERGVLQVEPLKLEDVTPIALPTRRVFVLAEASSYGSTSEIGIAFDTVEQAETCRDAIRYVVESGWNETARTRPVRPIQIVTKELPTADAVTAQKAALDEQRRRESANAEARRKHEEECKKVSDATSGVWADWRACREDEARRQKIRDTLGDYLRMTDGNEAMARAFLAKAFTPDEIAAAMGEPEPAAAPAASASALEAF